MFKMRFYTQSTLLSLLASTAVLAGDVQCEPANDEDHISRADAQRCVTDCANKGDSIKNVGLGRSDRICENDSGNVILVYNGAGGQTDSSFKDIAAGLRDIIDACPGDTIFATGPARGNSDIAIEVGVNSPSWA